MRIHCGLLVVLLLVRALEPLLAEAQSDPTGGGPGGEARAADVLVGKTYFEGLPFADARQIGEAGANHLIALLDDPAQRARWPNAVLVLGMAARPGAYEALAAAAERGSSGAVDRIEYRVRTTIPIAMGHLARSDPRAFKWLAARARDRAGDAGWSYGPFDGPRLADQLRRRAVDGLGLSGRSEALPVLSAIGAEMSAARISAAPDPELAGAIEQARALHARIVSEGADAVLASGGAR